MTQVMLILKNNANTLTEYEKLTAICFDEMSINKKITFDRKKEQVFGPHNHVQVVIARGITGKWKQPIYYQFDKAMTKDTLFQIICAVENSGHKVMSVTCDLGGQNRAVWRELGITTTHTSFKNPYDSSRDIYIFGDAPHLLKLARNHFVEKGFISDKNHITTECLEEIINKQTNDIKIAFKLQREHLYPKNKQNVKLAAQLFSNSLSKAVEFFGNEGLLSTNWKSTADVLSIFNDWFDVLNSQVAYGKTREKCGYGLHIDQQLQIIDKMSDFIDKMVVRGKKCQLPFQKGILITNKSLK